MALAVDRARAGVFTGQAYNLSNSEKHKRKPNLIVVTLIFYCLLLCGLTAWVSSRNRVTVMEASELICSNLVEADLLEGRGQCVITSDYSALIHTMFPLGVSKVYVQTGMSDLHLAEGYSNRYGLRKSVFGNPVRPWIDFHYDQENNLRSITIHD